jgi:chaperonin GroES
MKPKLPLAPLGDQVIILPDEPPGTTKGGIILPDSAQDRKTRGTVVAVGPGQSVLFQSRQEDGKVFQSRIPMALKIGDRVLYGAYDGRAIEHAGITYIIMHEPQIIATIED